MKKILILAFLLSIVTSLAACGSTMPYDLSSTESVEIHAYDNESTEPYAKISIRSDEAAVVAEMFDSLKLKELNYTDPSIRGYDFFFRDEDGDQIAKISLPYGPSPWVVCEGIAYQDVNGGIDLEFISQLVDRVDTAGTKNE